MIQSNVEQYMDKCAAWWTEITFFFRFSLDTNCSSSILFLFWLLFLSVPEGVHVVIVLKWSMSTTVSAARKLRPYNRKLPTLVVPTQTPYTASLSIHGMRQLVWILGHWRLPTTSINSSMGQELSRATWQGTYSQYYATFTHCECRKYQKF